MWEILFRHQDFVAINKPQGISVHRSDGEVSLTATLAAQLGVVKVWLLTSRPEAYCCLPLIPKAPLFLPHSLQKGK